MDLPFISDPFFYVVSVPAVLLLGMAAFRKDLDKRLLRFMLPLAPLRVWMGMRVEPALFYRLVYVGMFFTGCKLLLAGFY